MEGPREKGCDSVSNEQLDHSKKKAHSFMISFQRATACPQGANIVIEARERLQQSNIFLRASLSIAAA